MKTILVTLMLIAFTKNALSAILSDEWITFKLKHEKNYDSLAEEKYRLGVYQDNCKLIDRHNQRFVVGLETYTMAINQFADMTHDEFLQQYTGHINSNISQPVEYVSDFEKDDTLEELTSFDWRKHINMVPIKDQRSCGSCWAFAALTTLEYHLKIKKHQTIVLSEQQLIDCSGSYGNYGCKGGSSDRAYNYIRKNGISSSNYYPYKAKNGKCKYHRGMQVASIKGFKRVPSEYDMEKLVQYVGPLSASIHVSDSMHLYKNGIYNNPKCSKNVNHEVVIVGFGVYNNQKYWIVQNSWGQQWGMGGFILMSKNKNNQCGISTDTTYPLV